MFVGNMRNAEVRDLESAFGIEQKIFRLDIPVNHTLFFCDCQAFRSLKNDGRCNRVGHRFPSQGCAQSLQTLPVDKLHDEVLLVVLNAEVENFDDVGMPQCRNGLGFDIESFDKLVVGRKVGLNDLDGHEAVQ